MYLTMSGVANRALWKKIVPFLKAGNFQEAAAAHGQIEGSHRFDPDLRPVPG